MKLRDAFATPEHKQRYVRTLFATIAPRYDLITVLLSFGRDRAWKRRLVREANLTPRDRVLDLACGTGDLAFEAARAGARVIGIDVTARMIEIAATKARLATVAPRFVVADMVAVPVVDGATDVVTTGYGLRNVPSLDDAIAEIARVLRPGGRLLSLDFNRPESSLIRVAYLTYLTIVGSALGWALHRDPDTYRYIPASIRRYPGANGVASLLLQHGFVTVRIVPILFGLMTLHVATKK